MWKGLAHREANDGGHGGGDETAEEDDHGADVLRELEARKVAIDTEAANLQPIPRLAPAVIEGRLNEWRRLLRSSNPRPNRAPEDFAQAD